ncbi:MAG: hypothetical protein FJY07_04870 [Bacteroidetes bacterium]|nr:hypothetical protein [Bacteroidota bacterium]
MNFVNPGFLYGLFAVSVPIIIHLFNFRRFRKIYFTNVSFIRELKLQTQKQSKLRHLIILLLRIISVIAIVMAFAQPYIPVSENRVTPAQRNIVSIYIDNSFSMEAASESGSLLDEAREKAREIAGIYSTSDIFRLITNDFEGRHERFVSREEFINLVDEVSASPVSRSVPEIIARQNSLREETRQGSKVLYVLSPFQKSLLVKDFTQEDTAASVFFIPVEALNQDNLYIDSCWFESPVHQLEQNAELKVRIRNSSSVNLERLPIKLQLNDKQKALASFDVRPEQSAVVSMPFTESEPGIRNGIVEINDNAITFDDRFFISYNVSSLTSVLCVNGERENVFLNSLFGKDSSFLFHNVSQGNIDYSGLSGWQAIILNEMTSIPTGFIQEIVKFTENGGSLLVLPSQHVSPAVYQPLCDALQTGYFGPIDTSDMRINQINLEHPVFANVFDEIPENIDLPIVFKHFPIITQVRSRHESLLRLMNGESFISEFKVGKGRLFLFACPFEPSFSNFPKHAIFVPTLYKIAISSTVEEKLFYIIGHDDVVHVSNSNVSNDEVIHIKDMNSDFDFIPGHRRTGASIDLYPHDQVQFAGNYAVVSNSQTIKGIAFNYNRAESEMDFYTSDELTEFIKSKGLKDIHVIKDTGKPFEKSLAELTQGIRLWRWFILLALLCLLAESLLLRFRK